MTRRELLTLIEGFGRGYPTGPTIITETAAVAGRWRVLASWHLALKGPHLFGAMAQQLVIDGARTQAAGKAQRGGGGR